MHRALSFALPLRARLPGVARLRGFAAALVAQHAAPVSGAANARERVAFQVDPVARVLKRAVALTRVHEGAKYWQIVATLVRGGDKVAADMRTIANTTLLRQVLQRERLRTTLHRHTRNTLGVERVDRIVDTGVNREPQRVAAIVRREQPARFPRLALTVVRHAPPAASGAPAGLARDATAPSKANDRAWQAALRKPIDAPAPLPPQELSRVTDHVIRQLDRRVLSWQERTGRL